MEEYGISLLENLEIICFDAVIHAVAHSEFRSIDVEKLVKGNGAVYDVKATFDSLIIDGRL
jgi:UDP-N-acetyl-D-galactosamine dehydrogenase